MPLNLSVKLSALILLLSGLACITLVTGEIFTAVTDMEDILDSESVLILNLEKFIKAEQARINTLQLKLQYYKRKHKQAGASGSNFLGNPINAFVLLKRLTTEWNEVEDIMREDLSIDVLNSIAEKKLVLKFPSEVDLNGAAVAMTRLQDMYKMSASDVSRGYLNDVKYSSEMTPYDCFEMGKQLLLAGDDYHSTLWLLESYNQFKSQRSRSRELKGKILDHLQHAMFQQGHIHTALSLNNELLELYPDYQTALNNKDWYEQELKRLINVGKYNATEHKLINELEIVRRKHLGDILSAKLRSTYEALCQGKVDQSPKRLAKLKCRYQNGRSKFLILAPLKVEEVHLEPYIAVFHDVMYDSEIKTIKRLAKPRFKRASVFGEDDGNTDFTPANYRISKSGWLKDEENKHIRAVSLRVQDMSQMTVSTAEELQVVNYGIGGQYEPHYDFETIYDKDVFSYLKSGNRVATTLFYLTDVEEGGGTVFTKLKVGVWPKKGTAVFWHDLHKSGEGDYRTLHAGCPVMIGSKWVANKWQHIGGQEYLRPCELTPDYPLFEDEARIKKTKLY